MSIWDEPSRYGTCEPGTPEDWREAHRRVMGREEYEEILGDEKTPSKARTILGVAADATWGMIKVAWYKLARKHHPDQGGDEEEFKRHHAAYSVLADEFGEKS